MLCTLQDTGTWAPRAAPPPTQGPAPLTEPPAPEPPATHPARAWTRRGQGVCIYLRLTDSSPSQSRQMVDTPFHTHLTAAQNPPSTQTIPFCRRFLAVGGLGEAGVPTVRQGEGGTRRDGLARPSVPATKPHGVLVCSNNPPRGTKVAAPGPRTADSWIPQNIIVKTNMPAEKHAAYSQAKYK